MNLESEVRTKKSVVFALTCLFQPSSLIWLYVFFSLWRISQVGFEFEPGLVMPKSMTIQGVISFIWQFGIWPAVKWLPLAFIADVFVRALVEDVLIGRILKPTPKQKV
ncbi:MAG: hypothetical protein K2X47_00100 [Bdellovibrionales bacterium]|nr:hypothetical protein [Bdellovibrionales bacterium]